MPPISKDNHLYFITCVTNSRLPVFRTERLKQILAAAFDEARKSAGISIYAYVYMPDHYHVVTCSRRKASEVLRYLNGISARRVINYLKEEGFTSSLYKLRREESSNNREESSNNNEYRYSLWEHHSNTYFITSEAALMQKVNYIHMNPVEDGLIDVPENYPFSSFRYWKGRPLENEPLKIDIKELTWKRS